MKISVQKYFHQRIFAIMEKYKNLMFNDTEIVKLFIQ